MYKVLLVDDETINYQLFEKMVDWEAKGFMIAGTASDGQEALQKYEEILPDLIFMDIQLPLMDGLECVRCIREEDREVKIVIVSAYGEFSYAQRAIRYGVDDFLLKPVSRMMLNQLVDKIAADLAEHPIKREKASGFYGENREEYSEKELQIRNLDSHIMAAFVNNDKNEILKVTEEAFAEAKERMIKPDILKDVMMDLLVRMKYTLTRLEPDGTFSMMRNIHMEDIQKQEDFEGLKKYVREQLDTTFREIDENFYAKEKSLVFRTNAFADLHYMESTFSVQEAAEHNGLSKNYFAGLYKEQAGISFWEYVTELRIKRAKELLISTDDLVSAISSTIGYESEYHFSRKFKEVTGESPNHYRKRKRDISVK